MSRYVLILAAALLAAACQRAEEPQPATPAAAPAPGQAAAPAAPPVAPPVASPEIPVGACGDQGAIAAEERVANTPKWSTASEQENFGFDVYRGDTEDGEFARITQSPILGAGTSDEPHSYSFRDDTIDPCQDYWYYVESISSSGAREKFTPTFRAPAKRRAAD